MWEMIRILLPRAQQAQGEETNQELMYFGQPGGEVEEVEVLSQGLQATRPSH